MQKKKKFMNLTQGWEWRKGVDIGGKERKEGGGKD